MRRSGMPVLLRYTSITSHSRPSYRNFSDLGMADDQNTDVKLAGRKFSFIEESVSNGTIEARSPYTEMPTPWEEVTHLCQFVSFEPLCPQLICVLSYTILKLLVHRFILLARNPFKRQCLLKHFPTRSQGKLEHGSLDLDIFLSNLSYFGTELVLTRNLETSAGGL